MIHDAHEVEGGPLLLFQETPSIYAAPVRVILSEAKDPLRACERRLTRSGSFAGAQDDSLRFLLLFAARAVHGLRMTRHRSE